MRQLSDDMDTEQHRQVSQLLYEYQDIFSTIAFDMGCTKLTPAITGRYAKVTGLFMVEKLK